MKTDLLEYKLETAKPLVEEVIQRSGQTLIACYQCRRCAAGCPVGEETGYVTPDRLIRTITMGDRECALSNELVWKCVSCYTCGTRCPNDIQTARITETLKKMAKEEHVAPLRPEVAHFHDAFAKSGLRWGRVNEMEFMNAYELKNFWMNFKQMKWGAIFDEIRTQAKLGLSMWRHKRLHFGFMTSKGRKELKRLHKRNKEKQ